MSGREALELSAVRSLLSQSDGSAVENQSAASVKPIHDEGAIESPLTAQKNAEESEKKQSQQCRVNREAAAGGRSSHSIAPYQAQRPADSPSRSCAGTRESSRRKKKDPAAGEKAAKAYRLTNQLNYESEIADGFFDPGTISAAAFAAFARTRAKSGRFRV
jgi:hypothetical protein